jgi:hypothetical protein
VKLFEFLLKEAREHPKGIHVIFAGGYDFNMILRSLTRWHLKNLASRGYVKWKGYFIRLIIGKLLRIHKVDTGQSMTLWDVFPFFQTSFVKTLAAWGITTDSIDNIIAQKQQRNVFSFSDFDEIRRYCFQELEAFSLLMTAFHSSLREADIRVSRWDGPGAIAANLFGKHGVKRHMEQPSDEVNEAAQHAYFGGRIELIQQGNYEGEVNYYDINSAYPSVISELPSLANGRWSYHMETTPNDLRNLRSFSLCHLSWHHPSLQSFFPLPWRAPNGNVYFPPTGEGWYWLPEVLALADTYPGTFEVSEVWEFVDNEARPFAWVADMYEQRRQWKAEGRGGEKVLKLGLNSLYGKMIQQVGWNPNNERLPPYHQLEWGGYVTSATRAKLYRAASSNPDGVIGFETDGILTTSVLEVDIGNSLGAWGVDTYSGITYVQNGVYFLRNKRGWQPKFRGFDPGTLSRNSILRQWRKRSGSVVAKVTRFQGLGWCLQFDNRFGSWCKWITSDRELAVNEVLGKRGPYPCKRCDAGRCSKADRLHPTFPMITPGTMSTKYPLLWKELTPEWREAYRKSLDRDRDLYEWSQI